MAASPAFPEDPELLKQVVNNLLVRLNQMRPGLGDDLLKYTIKPVAMLEQRRRQFPDDLETQTQLRISLAAVAIWEITPSKHDSRAIAIHLERVEEFLHDIQFPTDPNDRSDRLILIKERQDELLAELQPVICRCRPRTQFFDESGKALFLKGRVLPRTIQGWAYCLVARYHRLTVGSLRNLAKPSHWAHTAQPAQ